MLVSEVSFFHFNPKLNILVPFLGFRRWTREPYDSGAGPLKFRHLNSVSFFS